MDFKKPKITHNKHNEVRKVGIELEFSKVDLHLLVHIIKSSFGGEHKIINQYYHEINGTEIGDFSVKVDSRLLTQKTYKKAFDKAGISFNELNEKIHLEEAIDRVIETVGSFIIPYEINFPPVSIYDLHNIEIIREKLYKNDLKGTSSHIKNAFATHINAEAPDFTIHSILNYLRAFILYYPWLIKTSDIDITRKLTPYINPFPQEYNLMVLDKDYNPSMDQMMKDYHRYSPDRNRPLDLYPLFVYINENSLDYFEDIANVKARPTYHYRLPNSEVDKPLWSIALEWNKWVKIEDLAAEEDQINYLSSAYRKLERISFFGFNNKWKKFIDRWENTH